MTHLSTLVPVSLLRRRRIGLFGGSFNPPHAGHLHVAREALRRLRLDEVWWLPARHNPLKPGDIYADHAQRLAQTRQLAHHPRFRVLPLEWRLGTTYTIDLLRALAPLLRQGRVVWIMGADSWATFHRWKDWRAIAAMIPIAVFDRPGATLAALTSPASRALWRYRLPQRLAPALAAQVPPAWIFLSIRRNPESSTRLRALAHQPRGFSGKRMNGRETRGLPEPPSSAIMIT